MRKAIVLAAVMTLAACHRPSMGGGARSIGAGFKKMGHSVAAVAAKVDVKIGIHVDRDKLVAMAKDKAVQQVTQQLAARVPLQPISLNKSYHHTSGGDEAPAPAPTVVEPTITRTTVDTGADQVWKNLSRDGEKATCEKVATFESCQATCSDHMRGESMRQLSKDAGKPVNCECTQGYSKCQ